MNTRQKGYYRDKAILEAIESRKALDTDQITALLFKDLAAGRRKAQERLFKLYKSGRVKRCRVALTEPYCYFTGKKNGRLEHLLALNWVYVWFMAGLKAWEQIHCFSYEANYKLLQADAFAGIRNTVTGKFKFNFVELDRSQNDFDKVRKYNRLYQDEGYAGRWWAKLTDRFPTILVTTTSTKRAVHIRQRIENENTAGLEFKLMLLSDIKEGLL
ncbi:hypothetical protein Dtox_3725 [Desulfofarcimen acetoxidans DSM 771]|uniref:Replication-relaxation n=1 Tax=Desulfofarcimen acetoxidans (strain ATCC 49208 / DSM 771 / KCTC 5769 / VKM B-1644 / 5575) TaxID=485916 RepID=C8VWR9_DESAS|nr:replication-relaxation family protein [Desulfofarcimen acetoxidans]ACV64433.1 hypothetical protein Dtox_3725 [Desulfofarcimen acetoxidans DSM 771]